MTDAVSRYGRCCFEIWEVLFRNMGGAKFAKAWIQLFQEELLAQWLASSPLDYLIGFKSHTLHHFLIQEYESRNIPRYTQRLKGGGNWGCCGESRTIPRYVSCCQSRTVPMYISFWQLHSHLYLEKSRVIWDSVTCLTLIHVFAQVLIIIFPLCFPS